MANLQKPQDRDIRLLIEDVFSYIHLKYGVRVLRMNIDWSQQAKVNEEVPSSCIKDIRMEVDLP